MFQSNLDLRKALHCATLSCFEKECASLIIPLEQQTAGSKAKGLSWLVLIDPEAMVLPLNSRLISLAKFLEKYIIADKSMTNIPTSSHFI